MTPSQNCINLIKRFEGCSLSSYPDPIGIWTIGYGSTSGVKPLMHITQEQADQRLLDDLQTAVRCVAGKVGTVMTQHQFDALVSLVFNVGCGAFSGSTILRQMNLGQPAVAANEFMRWVHAGTQVLPGLVNRRAAEKTLFCTAEVKA